LFYLRKEGFVDAHRNFTKEFYIYLELKVLGIFPEESWLFRIWHAESSTVTPKSLARKAFGNFGTSQAYSFS
jgi:hypothetical protein